MDDRIVPSLPPMPADLVLPPEFRLAVACSWIAPEPQAPLQNKAVTVICSGGVDWDAFLVQVDRHGMPVQALSVLRRCLGGDIPARLYRELKHRNKRTAVRSFVQMAEILRINRLLSEHAIDMIPLKGVLLSQRVYGAPQVRSSGDMDVLIRAEDLAVADRLLAQLGYRSLLNLSKRRQAALLVGRHHLNYYCEKSGQHLELHWRSHFWSRQDMKFFWQGRQTVRLLDEPIDFPDDPALFLFLCDHGSQHRWGRLKWLGDIAMMLTENDRVDWNVVPVLADRKGMHRVIAQAMLLVHWLYGLPLPLPIAELVKKEKAAPALAKKAMAAMLGGWRPGNSLLAGLLPRGIENALYYKRIRPAISWGRLLKELAICPTDYMVFPLPDRLFWLYVPLRPAFWFWRRFGGKLFPVLSWKFRAE